MTPTFRRVRAAAHLALAVFASAACTPLSTGAEFLAPLRDCESHGNYAAVSKSGKFRGAYQFSRSTWDSTARQVDPLWVGFDPAAAPSWEQDRMALHLWNGGRGRGHWPVCGRRVR